MFDTFLKWAELIVGMVEGRMHRDLDLNKHKILDVSEIDSKNTVIEIRSPVRVWKYFFRLRRVAPQIRWEEVNDSDVLIAHWRHVVDANTMRYDQATDANLNFATYRRVLQFSSDGNVLFNQDAGIARFYGGGNFENQPLINAQIGGTARARAYLSTVMNNLTSGTSYKVPLDAESWDPGNNFDSTTNHRFVAPKSGYYLVCAGIQYASVVANKVYYLQIKGNSIATRYARYHSSVAENLMVNFSDIVYLNANDYIELWALHYAGVNTVDVGIGEGTTFLAVSYISS